MGNTVNKDEVVIAQSDAQIKEAMVWSYSGWAMTILLVLIFIIFLVCRYGITKIKKWFLSQVETVQERAVQLANSTRASFRRPREQPQSSTKLEIS